MLKIILIVFKGLSGTRYWNALPNNLRIIKDIEKFKKDLKTLLFMNFEEIKQKAFIYKPI